MLKKVTSTLVSLAAVAVLAAAPGAALAQSPDEGSSQEQPAQGTMHQHMQGHMQGTDQAEDDEASGMSHQDMMARMQKMNEMRQQRQAELEDLAARMNAATGEAQQQLMAELLTNLVEQRGMMANMPMRSMTPGMMQQMHSGEEGGMADCPMMQGGHGSGSDTAPDAGDSGAGQR